MKKLLKYIPLVFLSSFPIGISIRFILAYFNHQAYYPCLFDVLFDWLGNLLAGISLLILTIKNYLNKSDN